MEKVLAVDYGRKRVGLAVSDPLGISTRPLDAIVRQDRDARGLARAVAEVAAEESAGRVVVGLPLQLDGTEGLAVQEVREFIERLRECSGLPVDEEDERLTSRQSHAVLKSGGMKHKQRKAKVDSAAAQLLLQSYLARRKRET